MEAPRDGGICPAPSHDRITYREEGHVALPRMHYRHVSASVHRFESSTANVSSGLKTETCERLKRKRFGLDRGLAAWRDGQFCAKPRRREIEHTNPFRRP
jgi:hypothetical protein